MGEPTLEILDGVHCKANKYARPVVKKCLSYKATTWKRGRYGQRNQEVVKQYLITGKTGSAGTFLTGLLPRVKKYCKDKGFKIKIKGSYEKIKPSRGPTLKGITFRSDQAEALAAIEKIPRGIIVHPTGSGKTIIAMGIFSMFPKTKRLFLCHTKDLINQALDELNIYKFKNVFVMGGGYKANIKDVAKTEGAILLSTIQTFAGLDVDDYIDLFDVTIVDEVHHVNDKKSQYGKVMESNLSPRKYGLTATKPTTDRESLTNEGFFGPVIAELSLEEGIESGILAVPKINLVPISYNFKINKKCHNTYKNFYKFGVVQNKERNKLIVSETNISLKNDKITLIVIERTEHGKILQKMFKKTLGINVPFVQGSTDRAKRLRVKKRLQKGRLKIAICSKVWREGINIPSLNHVILAVGMKEEKMVLQTIGRGLRTAKGKRELKFTDFLDPYRYLAEHTVLRMQIYKKKGWI